MRTKVDINDFKTNHGPALSAADSFVDRVKWYASRGKTVDEITWQMFRPDNGLADCEDTIHFKGLKRRVELALEQ